jgi:hypothetical protein
VKVLRTGNAKILRCEDLVGLDLLGRTNTYKQSYQALDTKSRFSHEVGHHSQISLIYNTFSCHFHAFVLHSNKYHPVEFCSSCNDKFVRQSWSMFPKIHFSPKRMTKHGRSQHIEISFSLLGALDANTCPCFLYIHKQTLDFSCIDWQCYFVGC